MIHTRPQRPLPPPESLGLQTARLFSAPLAHVVLLLLTIATSCSQERDHAQAFQQHMNELAAWAPVEAETARSIQRILASQFVDEAAVRQEIAQAVPRIEAHLARIGPITPDDPDLRKIHERYRRAWHDILEGLQNIPAALDRADAQALASSRSAITAWRESMIEIANDLRRLRPDPPADKQ